AVAAMSRKPSRTLLNNPSDPMERLHVVFERRAAEQTYLSNIGRAQTRLPALALDGFDHGGFFSADVRACAPPEMDFRQRIGRIRLQGRDLPLKDRATAVIFITKVDVDRFDSHSPSSD